MEVEFIEPDISDIVSVQRLKYPEYTPIALVNVRTREDAKGKKYFIGEFYNPNPFEIKEVALVILFRDQNGKLLGGDTRYFRNVGADKNTPFELDISSDLITDDYEIYFQIG